MKKIFLKFTTLIAFVLFIMISSGCNNKQIGKNIDENLETVLETENEIEIGEQTESISTISKIFKEGKTVTCYFMINMGNDQVSDGTLSVDGDKMRYNMNGFIEGQSIENWVIVKDGYSYSWSSLQPGKGYKIKENENNDEFENIGPEEQNQETKFTCKKGIEGWEFDLPGDIKFEEFNYDNSNI